MTTTFRPYTLEQADSMARAEHAQVNILITVDAETLLKDMKWEEGKPPIGSEENPRQLDPDTGKYIRLLVRTRNRGTETPGNPANLEVYAGRRESVYWRETTLSMNAQYYALLYRFHHLGGDYVFGQNAGGDSDIRAKMFKDVLVPLPDPHRPTKPKTQKIQDFTWYGTVEVAPGKWEKYDWSFMILRANKDETDLEVLGYFRWDPKITVKNV